MLLGPRLASPQVSLGWEAQGKMEAGEGALVFALVQ